MIVVEKMLYAFPMVQSGKQADLHYRYDQAQLLSNALELALLLPPSPVRDTLHAAARSILTYSARDLRSPAGGFYSAEDADSLPARGAPAKKEGAFYVWTTAELDAILGEDSDVFRYRYGATDEGNCDPRHDIQGELRGQVRVHFKWGMWRRVTEG